MLGAPMESSGRKGSVTKLLGEQRGQISDTGRPWRDSLPCFAKVTQLRSNGMASLPDRRLADMLVHDTLRIARGS